MAGVYERDGVWYAVPKPISLAQAIRGALLNALAYTNGHQSEAADLLGLSQRQMNYQLQIHHVPRPYDGERGERVRPAAGKLRTLCLIKRVRAAR